MVKMIELGADPFMSVTLGVGPGRANNIDDVTLVQFMLNIFFQDKSNAVLRQRAGATGKALAVDGIIGPKTKAQILLFQKDMTQRGIFMKKDGCVDRIPNGADSDLYGGGFYTMPWLHFAVSGIAGKPVHEMGVDLPSVLFMAAAKAGYGPEWAQWKS